MGKGSVILNGKPAIIGSVIEQLVEHYQDKNLIIYTAEEGDKGNPGASFISAEFVGNDLVFTKDDTSKITLIGAKLDLEGDAGDTGASIISAEFIGNDIVFTKDDATTVTITNGKTDLTGPAGVSGLTPAEITSIQNIIAVEDEVINVTNQSSDIVPTGLVVDSTGLSIGTGGSQTAYVVLTWDSITSDTIDHYTIRYKVSSYTYYTYIDTKVNTLIISGLIPNTTYNFGVLSVNKYGIVSAYSSNISQLMPSDTVEPSDVVVTSATASIQSAIIVWIAGIDIDLQSYNIYRNTVNDSSTSSLIGNTRANYFIDGGRTGGTVLYYWIKAVDTSGNLSVNYSNVVTCTPRNVASSDTNIAHQGWMQTCVFSSTDINTVSWTSGTFTTSAGTSYSIGANNTGNMSARTYIYLDIAISVTEYQTTTTALNAVGEGKVLVGVAQNTVAPGTEAVFQIFGGTGGVYINGSDIVASTVTTNEIAANTIVAGNIQAGTITATEIDTSTITSLTNLVIGSPQVLIDGSVTFLNSWLSYKGVYNAGTTYKIGDQVGYPTAATLWNYINVTPASGHTPAEDTWWTTGGTLQRTTIDGGRITADTITTSHLNFVVVESTNVIASINASIEGITIEADNIAISGSTTFDAGYNPSVKRRVFVAEPTTPYDIGDLWTDGSVLKKCKTALASGAYNAAHWELATGYTDDTVANTKIRTFYQDAIPTSVSAGDLWVDTNDGNKMYRATNAGDDQIVAGEWIAVPDANKLNLLGGSYSTAAAGARVLIFPDANTGIQVIDDATADVFKVIIGGTNVGDVIIGNYSGGQGIFYDKSLATTTFKGSLTTTSATIGGWTVNATSIYTGTEDHSGYTANAGDITIYSSGTIGSIHAKNFYIDTSGNIVAQGGTIGGFTLSTSSLMSGSTVTKISLSTIDGIHIGDDVFANAPFSISLAGSLKAIGIVELGTNAITDGSYTQNIAIIGGQIRENSRNDDNGCLYFNLHGYNGGDTKYRNTIIGNGKGDTLVLFNGTTNLVSIQSDFQCIDTNILGEIDCVLAKKIVYAYTTVSDTVILSHDTEITTTNTSYVKLKTITLGTNVYIYGRTLRIKFDLKTSDPDFGISYAKIYKNGSPLGTERTNITDIYTTFSEDLGVFGSLSTIELWAKTNNASYITLVQNFRVCGTLTSSIVNEITGTIS